MNKILKYEITKMSKSAMAFLRNDYKNDNELIVFLRDLFFTVIAFVILLYF